MGQINKSKFLYLKELENIIIEKMSFYIENFATYINTKIIFHENEVSIIKFFTYNSSSTRAIEISVSTGINVDSKVFHNFRMNIHKTTPDQVLLKSFSIRDYLSFLNQTIELNDFFIGETNINEHLSRYLDLISFYLKNNDVNSILFSDKWVDIDPDLRPYK